MSELHDASLGQPNLSCLRLNDSRGSRWADAVAYASTGPCMSAATPLLVADLDRFVDMLAESTHLATAPLLAKAAVLETTGLVRRSIEAVTEGLEGQAPGLHLRPPQAHSNPRCRRGTVHSTHNRRLSRQRGGTIRIHDA
jgi:hypothetical protein